MSACPGTMRLSSWTSNSRPVEVFTLYRYFVVSAFSGIRGEVLFQYTSTAYVFRSCGPSYGSLAPKFAIYDLGHSCHVTDTESSVS